MRSLSLLLLWLTLLLGFTKSIIKNDMIQRTIDLTHQLVKVQAEITFHTSNNEEINAYTLIFPANVSSHISYISAMIGKTSCNVKEDAVTQYTIEFPSTARKADKLSLTYYLTHSLVPFPKEIAQHEEQFLLYNDMHIMMSMYETKEQTTTIKLPSERVENYSDHPKPSSHQKNIIKYGPYENIAANTLGRWVQVHFPSNMQFATLTNVVKEMELSFWGKLSVEETYEMINTGAKLKNGFSRLDYEISNQRGNSIDQLTAVLPEEAHDVYYRDQIGNVTTSRFRPGRPSYLFLRPRFPVFGGWKTQWYMGYTLPVSSLLSQKSQIDYTLKVDFSVDVENTIVDHLTVKVILPEGVKNPVVRNLPSKIERNQTKRLTYLDTSLIGRTVLIFKKDNVINKHNVPIEIDFQFDSTYLLLEPALLSSAFFVFFLILIVLSRINFKLTISKKEEQKVKKE